MKKLLFLIAVCFSLSTSFARVHPPTTYERVRTYLIEEGYTIAENRYEDLKEGGTTYLRRTFHEGLTYIIYGFSEDDDVTDLDLTVYYSDGSTVYKKDTETDATPVLIFTPASTREMKIVLKNYSSDTPEYASRCRFFVAYK